MNRHIETLINFKNGSKSVAKECFEDIKDAGTDLLSAFKNVSRVLFVVVIWLFLVPFVILALPLATRLRLKFARDAIANRKKAAEVYAGRVQALKRR